MVIYIAASPHDGRFTRICVASVRHFYPHVPVRLLAGGPPERGLADELQQYWEVSLSDAPSGDYGWGFVKLEPLFRPAGERFLVLDSDTVITGPVLDLAAEREEDFIVDDEVQPAERAQAIYYDCVRAAEERRPIRTPAFLFNTGQWFGKSGVLSRRDFARFIEWGFPPRLTRPSIFKNGEQGVLNHVVNEQCRAGKITVARVPLMRWPGHGIERLSVDVVSGRSCPPLVVHWAGMKKARQRDMVGADLLAYFEKQYYQRLPSRSARGIVKGLRHATASMAAGIQARVRR